MNPNDVLAGLNILIAAGWISWGILFLYTLLYDRPRDGVDRVFLLIMGLIFCINSLDYGTTATLRAVDLAVYPGIPHSLLPDFSIFPLGITLMIVWRVLIVVGIWGLLGYVLYKKNKERNSDVHTTVD